MPWLDDLIGDIRMLALPGVGTATQGLPLPAGTSTDEDFWGLRPGFDIGDIPEFFKRLTGGGIEELGAGGQQEGLDPSRALPRIPGPGGIASRTAQDIGRLLGLGNGNGNGNGQVRAGTTSMYIGGNCPGLWHTTPTRVVFDRNTGAARQVGGNRRSNRVSLVQDDSGALEFVAPVKATWSLKYKTRKRYGHRHKAHHRRHPHVRHHPKRVSHGHHGYTAKQLAAGFGGKAHMRHR